MYSYDVEQDMSLLGQLLDQRGVLDRAYDRLHTKGLELLRFLLRTDEDTYLEGVLLGVCEQLAEDSATEETWFTINVLEDGRGVK